MTELEIIRKIHSNSDCYTIKSNPDLPGLTDIIFTKLDVVSARMTLDADELELVVMALVARLAEIKGKTP